MGQCWLIVNIDKEEYLDPEAFGNGCKITEFGNQGGGVMMALAALLADGNGRGGGDVRSDSELIGRWAGDRIVVAGDYGDAGKFVSGEALSKVAFETFTDISGQIAEAIAEPEEGPVTEELT